MIQDISTPAALRAHNLSLALNLIRERGSITRAELIKLTKLSAPTISALVNVLIDSDFVREAGIGVSSGGRRPIVLEFNYDARFVIGIDMGATHITCLLVNLNGQIVARQMRRMDVIGQPQPSLETINSMIFQVTSQSGVNMEDILGIGLTIPAPLNDDHNGTFLTYYMPAWKGIRPAEVINRSYSLPIYMENDANAAAIAEKWWGSGRGYDSLAYIKIGTGVGSGLVINNEIYRGYSGSAGEIGHTTIETNGRRCRCGNQGCMESYVGLPGILMDARTGLSTDPRWKKNLDHLSLADIILAAKEGNEFCIHLIQHAGKYLGIGMANMINLVNPGLLIIGGDLTEAGDILMDPVRSSLRERTIPFESHLEKITLGELGENAVALGAAAVVIQKAFSAAHLYATLRRKYSN